MNTGTCDQCLAADRPLWPVTRHKSLLSPEPITHYHWVPANVCFACLGPAYLDKDEVPITIQKSQEYRGLPRKTGRQRDAA